MRINRVEKVSYMENAIKIGDIVCLASGGPRMTVSSEMSEGFVNVTWFVVNTIIDGITIYGDYKHGRFPVSTLTAWKK